MTPVWGTCGAWCPGRRRATCAVERIFVVWWDRLRLGEAEDAVRRGIDCYLPGELPL